MLIVAILDIMSTSKCRLPLLSSNEQKIKNLFLKALNSLKRLYCMAVIDLKLIEQELPIFVSASPSLEFIVWKGVQLIPSNSNLPWSSTQVSSGLLKKLKMSPDKL